MKTVRHVFDMLNFGGLCTSGVGRGSFFPASVMAPPKKK
jgi:hypothetical protein